MKLINRLTAAYNALKGNTVIFNAEIGCQLNADGSISKDLLIIKTTKDAVIINTNFLSFDIYIIGGKTFTSNAKMEKTPCQN